ncbi:MAG: alpha/beta hydrolase [Alphaproteobacteria bacterium]|nr:alpha/beta hydrolase [Alphaproteobacteria bacterium]
MLKKNIKIFFITIITSWVVFCASVYFMPELYFYNPSLNKADITNAISNDFPAEEVKYNSYDGTELYGWFIKPKNNKIIVFFHGNSYNIESFYHKLIPFVEGGYGAFIGEYRGFGGIKGKINEKNLGEDAISAVKYLYSQGFTNKDLILYGMSLGSYTSTHTAYSLGKDEAFAGLILEVPFDSILNVVKQRIPNIFPFSYIIKDKYDNTSKISQLNLPVLIMGASDDKVVPIERAEDLYKQANNPKKMITYKGASHSDLYNYRNWRDIRDWLKANEKNK